MLALAKSSAASTFPAYRPFRPLQVQARSHEPGDAAQPALLDLTLSESVPPLSVAQPVEQRALLSA